MSSNAATIEPVTFSVRGLAAHLGVGVTTIERLRAQRKLPKALKINKRVLWTKKDIERWIEWDMPNEVEFARLKSK